MVVVDLLTSVPLPSVRANTPLDWPVSWGHFISSQRPTVTFYPFSPHPTKCLKIVQRDRFWIYSGNGPEIIRLQDMAKSHMHTILMWSAKHLERKTSGPTSPSWSKDSVDMWRKCSASGHLILCNSCLIGCNTVASLHSDKWYPCLNKQPSIYFRKPVIQLCHLFKPKNDFCGLKEPDNMHLRVQRGQYNLTVSLFVLWQFLYRAVLLNRH